MTTTPAKPASCSTVTTEQRTLNGESLTDSRVRCTGLAHAGGRCSNQILDWLRCKLAKPLRALLRTDDSQRQLRRALGGLQARFATAVRELLFFYRLAGHDINPIGLVGSGW